MGLCIAKEKLLTITKEVKGNDYCITNDVEGNDYCITNDVEGNDYVLCYSGKLRIKAEI